MYVFMCKNDAGYVCMCVYTCVCSCAMMMRYLYVFMCNDDEVFVCIHVQ